MNTQIADRFNKCAEAENNLMLKNSKGKHALVWLQYLTQHTHTLTHPHQRLSLTDHMTKYYKLLTTELRCL